MAPVFEGIRVVEIATEIAASIAGMLLADNGAEVIKVELPGGDRLRGEPAFHVYNRGKQSAVADWRTRAGGEAVAGWVAGAEVVLIDLPTPAAERYRLDYPALGAGRTDLVYVAVPPFGDHGPMAALAGGEAAVAAYGGLFGEQAAHDGPPTFLVLPVASTAAGILAAGAVAVGLMHRHRSGAGQRVVASVLAGVLASQTDSLVTVDGVTAGEEWDLGHEPLGDFPVFRVYKASDDYFALACGNPQFWYRLCLMLDRPEWISDPRLEHAPWGIPRAEDRHWLADRLTDIFATRPRADWLALLAKEDIPASPVLAREEFFAQPQIAANQMRAAVDDAELGPTAQIGDPVRFHRTPGGPGAGAPRLDRHTASPQRAPQPAAGSRPLPSHALAGVRVVDLAGYIAGTYCPAVLADLGADVIKVESRDGDPFRALGHAFLGYNRGKQGVVLDLKTEEGREVVYRLLRDADVVVENYRPGTARRLGLDYESVAAVNPRIVYASVYAYGSGGPRAGQPGFDTLLQAESGIMRSQGGPGHEPVYLTASVCDFDGALLAAFGVLAALYEREVSGVGQHVEASLLNAALTLQAADLISYEGKPRIERGEPDLKGLSPICRCYRTADGPLFLKVDSESAYRALLDLTRGEASEPGRSASPPAFDVVSSLRALDDPAPAIARALGRRPTSDWLTALRSVGVTAIPIRRGRDLPHDEQVLANDLVDIRAHPLWGMTAQVGAPLKFDRTPSFVQRPAPILGEHTREILLQLGYSDGEADSMIARGVATQGSVEEQRKLIIDLS